MARTLARLTLLGAILLCWQVWTPTAVYAQERQPDTACILCHVDLDEHVTLPSGETLDLEVELGPLAASVHGVHSSESVYCTDCHADRLRYRYPHVENPAQSLSEFSDEIAENCERCHTSSEAHNPGHLQALDNPNLPVCTDCHGGHEVEFVDTMEANPEEFCIGCHDSIGEPPIQNMHDEFVANMPAGQTCESCHSPVELTENDECVACHSLLTSDVTLASGESINLHVDPQTIIDSVHGHREIEGVEYAALQCTDCHEQEAFTGFPHLELYAVSRRDYTLDMESVCQDCHEEVFDEHRDDVHRMANEKGNLDAATCFDCHGSHDIQDPADPRQRISETCGECHTDVYDQYAHSVHGAALVGENDSDVPVCTDCHGVHQIQDPQTARFRVESPTMCGECHADEEMMERHDISTDVFDTYVADFHGTTVALFEKQSPDHETNKAVCYDCHGVHDILAVNDENSKVIKDNLLQTCRDCHPNANANFPDSWTSHYKPSLQHNPLVYFINQFYAFLIPFVVGGFMLFIGTDVFRRFRNRREDDTEE